MLSVFITPWMKPTFIHCGDQPRLALDHGVAAAPGGGRRRAGQVGVVARDRVVGQLAQLVQLAARGEVLEGADAQVAGGHARQHGAGQRVFAQHRLAGGHHGQRARGRDAQRVHGLADEYSRSIGPTAALPSPPREKGVRPEPLSCDVAARAVAVDRPRPAAARGRRRAAARSRRTGGRRRPARSARRPRAARCRRTAPRPRRWPARRRPGPARRPARGSGTAARGPVRRRASRRRRRRAARGRRCCRRRCASWRPAAGQGHSVMPLHRPWPAQGRRQPAQPRRTCPRQAMARP